MDDALKRRALGLYTPPFRYECGYIFDRNGAMVADEAAMGNYQDAATRIRGWGRIQYLDNPEGLQDAVGEIIADLLSKYWNEDIVGAAQRVLDQAQKEKDAAAVEIEQKNRLIELLTEQVRVSLDGLPIDAEKMLAWLENMSQNRSQPDSDNEKTGQTLPTGDSDG